jgi:hypothetical protein
LSSISKIGGGGGASSAAEHMASMGYGDKKSNKPGSNYVSQYSMGKKKEKKAGLTDEAA